MHGLLISQAEFEFNMPALPKELGHDVTSGEQSGDATRTSHFRYKPTAKQNLA